MTGSITFRSFDELAEFVAGLSQYDCKASFEAGFESGHWMLRFVEP